MLINYSDAERVELIKLSKIRAKWRKLNAEEKNKVLCELAGVDYHEGMSTSSLQRTNFPFSTLDEIFKSHCETLYYDLLKIDLQWDTWVLVHYTEAVLWEDFRNQMLRNLKLGKNNPGMERLRAEHQHRDLFLLSMDELLAIYNLFDPIF